MQWTYPTRPIDFELDRAVALMSLGEGVSFSGSWRLNGNQEIENRGHLRLNTLIERRDGYLRQRTLEIGRNGLASVGEVLWQGPLLRVMEQEIIQTARKAMVRRTLYDPESGNATCTMVEVF